jgi:hypothetical protein
VVYIDRAKLEDEPLIGSKTFCRFLYFYFSFFRGIAKRLPLSLSIGQSLANVYRGYPMHFDNNSTVEGNQGSEGIGNRLASLCYLQKLPQPLRICRKIANNL